MLKIYGFGPAPGLPDLSPYVLKAMTLLKMAGVDYVVDTTGFRRAPKGKLPYIEDDGVIVADSTFIRFHLEKTRGVDFDAGLSPVERAQSWAIEKLCEDHLSSIVALHRWRDEENFRTGIGAFFDKMLPAPLRAPAKWIARRGILKRLWRQGIGRFNDAELGVLGQRDVDALATLLGDKPFLMGANPCAADAAVFAALTLLMDPATVSATRDAALSRPNLVAYRDRMMGRYFPAS
ncbi:MAG: glutathione S-transferase C-terminal domain-containing protein [Methylocystis sp.]|uniref:glutathione S-transferase family protein n=1 Tax=Methylocystis sp. TaxID=1911079 RepID=UPI003DA24172